MLPTCIFFLPDVKYYGRLLLPTKYDAQMKGFCLYHQKDFDNLSEEQQQKLIEHHGKALEIIHV
jgi:myo-inositol catabolism protein IolC